MALCLNQKQNEIITKCFVIIRQDSNLILLYFHLTNKKISFVVD